MTVLIGAVILLAMMALAVPIGFALGLAGTASLAMIIPWKPISVLLGNVVFTTTSSSVMLTIPMFVLMAEFLSTGGVARDLFLACNRLTRGLRGGLAMACIMAGAIHAAATGSSSASAASLARASFPAMKIAGYSPQFAVGTIAIAGTLAIMIPPSVAFVLYGIITETSIGKLFLAGVVPGLLTALGYIVAISVTLRLKPELGPSKEAEEAAYSTRSRGKVWPMLLLIVVILGSLYGGVATPTEVAAIGAVGALIISLSSGRMTKQGFIGSIGHTLRISTMIITIVFGAHVLGYFISFSRVTEMMLAWISASGMPPTAVMLLIVFVYLLLGTFMDQAAIIILTAPITTALMVGLGYDAIWWGVIMIKTAEVGMVTPPLGMVTFVTASATKTDLKTSFVGVMPFVIAELILLGILIFFPTLTLWLPNL